jgi:hypothetical protein
MDELVEFLLAYDAAADARRGGSTDAEIEALWGALEIAHRIINA